MANGLKQYVSAVRKLEIQKETLAKTITSIDRTIDSLGVPRKINKENNPVELNFFGMYAIPLFLDAVILIFGSVFFFSGVSEFSTVYYTAKGTQNGDGGTLCLIGGFCLLVGIMLLGYIGYRYKQQKKIYIENEEIIAENYELDKQDDELRVRDELIIRQNYQFVRNGLYNTYAQTCNTLKALYAKNVIYPKYQNNLVAICMFYEYLESGRCVELTGHEGAYNIYEQELRMGIIIEKLDIVIRKLDEIQNNQYALYAAMKQISNQQTSILNSLNKIQQNQIVQNENLEYIRYNSEALKLNSDIAMIYSLR